MEELKGEFSETDEVIKNLLLLKSKYPDNINKIILSPNISNFMVGIQIELS